MTPKPTDAGAAFADSWTRRHQPTTPPAEPSGRLVQLAEQFLATQGAIDESDAAARQQRDDLAIALARAVLTGGA